MDAMTEWRREAWVLCVVVIDVALVLTWVTVLLLRGPGLTPFDPGQPLYLLPPAVFVLSGATGLVMLVRMGVARWLSPIGVSLWLSSVLVLAPLALYALLEYLLFSLRDF